MYENENILIGKFSLFNFFYMVMSIFEYASTVLEPH